VETDETVDSGLRAEFEELRARGRQATDEGRLAEALELYEACVERARALGDQDLADLAFANRCAVLIALGRHEGLVRDLRDILSRSANRLNRLIAAYHLARIYELRNDIRKGLLYARIARGELQKRGVRDPYWEAGLHNQMGSFFLLESRFAEAAEEYRRALDADPEAPELRLAVSWHNLGYCCLVLGDTRNGIELLYRSLAVHRRARVADRQMQAHLDLCYGHLETGRYGLARRHGGRALALAEEHGDAFGLKNALYLLGEAERLLGHDDRARACFDRLQRLFPDTPFLTDVLMAVDIRQMINLRA
jgi:tetratricopeptide (TPR) repeat protein